RVVAVEPALRGLSGALTAAGPAGKLAVMQLADAHADNSGTIEIGYSLAKMIGLTLGAAVLTAAAAAICVIAPDDVFALVVGVVGVLLFGLCTVMLVWRLRTEPVVLTLVPEGLRDVRIAQEFIPWEAIEDVSVFTMNNQSFVVLK